DGRLCLALLDWHGGQSSAVYALGSSWLAHLHAAALFPEIPPLWKPPAAMLETIRRAVGELTPDPVTGKLHPADVEAPEARQRRELETLRRRIRARFPEAFTAPGPMPPRDSPGFDPLNLTDEEAARVEEAERRRIEAPREEYRRECEERGEDPREASRRRAN